MSKYEVVTINNKLVSIDLSNLMENNILVPRQLDSGRIYIIQFDDGKIKIGKTKNIKQRIRTLCSQSGRSCNYVCVSEYLANAGEVELYILDQCARVQVQSTIQTEYVNNTLEECVDFLQKEQIGVKLLNAKQLEDEILYFRNSLPSIVFTNNYDEPLYKILQLKNIEEQRLYILSWVEHSAIYEICFDESLNEFYQNNNLPDNCDFRSLCLLDFNVTKENIIIYRELCKFNVSMIELGMDFEERKEKLQIRYGQLIAKLLS